MASPRGRRIAFRRSVAILFVSLFTLPIFAGTRPVPPGLLWVDREHEDAAVNRKQVAITADGEFVLTGWWVNNERVQLYRRGEKEIIEWRADLAGSEWFLPLESDDLGRTLVCASRGNGGALASALYVWPKTSSDPDYQFPSPAEHVWVDAETCSDGRYVFGLAQGPSPGYAGRVTCYGRETGSPRWSYQLAQQCLGMDCSDDGALLAVSDRWETVVLETGSGTVRDTVMHGGGSQALPAISGDGSLLAVGTTDGRVSVFAWNGLAYVEQWHYDFPLLGDESFVSCVDVSTDGSTVAAGTLDFPEAGGYGGSCAIFGAAAPLPLVSLTTFGDQVNEVELTPDGSRLAAVSHGTLGSTGGLLLAVCDRDSGRTVFTVCDNELDDVGSTYSVALSADGAWAAFGGKAGHAREEGSGGFVALARLPFSFLAFVDDGGTEVGELVVGPDLRLRLEDRSADADPGLRESVEVTVENTGGSDVETVVLLETGPNTGVFGGSLPTAFSPSDPPVAGDGRLDCGSGDLLQATYVDAGDPADIARAEALSRWPSQVVCAPGPDRGNPALARITDPFGQDDLAGELEPYGPAAGFGLRLALGDIDGDGVDEIVTGPGPGPPYGPLVRAFEADGAAVAGVSFMAYGTLKYGVNVACGDVDGDGIDEIVTGAGPGAVFGPHVRGWNVDGTASTPIPGVSFFAYGTLKYGVNVACGDVDGDGIDEIVTGAGPGTVFGPHVRGWDHDGGPGVVPIPGMSFLAYGTDRFGVNVACADLEGDGTMEVVTGPGPGDLFAAHVRAWRLAGDGTLPVPGVSFLAYGGSYRYGARVAAADIDLDGADELLTVPGADLLAPCRVRAFEPGAGGIVVLDYCDFLAFEGQVTRGGGIAAGRLR